MEIQSSKTPSSVAEHDAELHITHIKISVNNMFILSDYCYCGGRANFKSSLKLKIQKFLGFAGRQAGILDLI